MAEGAIGARHLARWCRGTLECKAGAWQRSHAVRSDAQKSEADVSVLRGRPTNASTRCLRRMQQTGAANQCSTGRRPHRATWRPRRASVRHPPLLRKSVRRFAAHRRAGCASCLLAPLRCVETAVPKRSLAALCPVAARVAPAVAARAAAALVLASLLAACAEPAPGPAQLKIAQQQKLIPPANETLPLSLRAGSQEVLQDVLSAVGDEVWNCRRSGGTLQWVPAGAEATLVDQARRSVGTVMPNRMFSAYDGSYVIGRVAADETVTPGALPWQRMAARFNAGERAGEGRFARTTSVQRLLTSGGLPPDNACDQEGVSLFVPYSATYLFYRASDPAAIVPAPEAEPPLNAASTAQ